jgi:hypothetical protein
MSYLYHMVPTDQIGTTLYPLNQLRDVQPELYKTKASKYDGREHIMERQILILDCLWNDVLHLSPIPPQELKAALLEAGMPDRTFSYYQIDPASLTADDTVLYLHQTTDRVVAPDDSEFVPYDINLLPTLAQIPDWTKQYYAEQYASGQKPLRFLGIPHILHKGTIDTTNLPIVTV